jgi:uncharacterized protein YdeI (YjbR/CyaY-like superfamily)
VKPAFFETQAAFRAWLEEHHADRDELLVGFYKRKSRKPSITWAESVDEALCFGWIDGIRNTLDDDSYTIRFTPRRPHSNWSLVNIARAKELVKLGLMCPAGLRAFKQRDEKAAAYSYEQRETAKLDAAAEREFQRHPKAWEFFQQQPRSYRKTAIFWVVSAKREETRRTRLSTLIDDSEHDRRIAPLTRPPKKP